MKKLFAILLITIPLMAHADHKRGIEIVTSFKYGFGNDNFVDPSYPKTLMSIEQREQKALLNATVQNDPYDTHLKKNISQIKLIYDFKVIPNLSPKNVIGFAAIGTWKEGGWTGAKEFFKDNNLGTCEYINWPILYMQIDRNIIRDDVNGRITTVSTDGNKDDGYLYNVSWYVEDKTKDVTEYQINCANMVNDPTIIKRMIDLAKSIPTPLTPQNKPL